MRFLIGVILSATLVVGFVEGWKTLQRAFPASADHPSETRSIPLDAQSLTEPAAAPSEIASDTSDVPTSTERQPEMPEAQPEPTPVPTFELTAQPPETAIDPAPPVAAPEALRAEAAWAPFHSEYSAHAFANLMTARIERPFDVRRTPSRRFEVFFLYASEPERREVLEQIAAITAGARQVRGEST